MIAWVDRHRVTCYNCWLDCQFYVLAHQVPQADLSAISVAERIHATESPTCQYRDLMVQTLERSVHHYVEGT